MNKLQMALAAAAAGAALAGCAPAGSSEGGSARDWQASPEAVTFHDLRPDGWTDIDTGEVIEDCFAELSVRMTPTPDRLVQSPSSPHYTFESRESLIIAGTVRAFQAGEIESRELTFACEVWDPLGVRDVRVEALM